VLPIIDKKLAELSTPPLSLNSPCSTFAEMAEMVDEIFGRYHFNNCCCAKPGCQKYCGATHSMLDELAIEIKSKLTEDK
jgi:hypothetical protein